MVTGFYLGSNRKFVVDSNGMRQKDGPVHIDLSSYMVPTIPSPKSEEVDPAIFSDTEIEFDVSSSSSMTGWKEERIKSVNVSREHHYDNSRGYGFNTQRNTGLEDQLLRTSVLYQSNYLPYTPTVMNQRYDFPQRTSRKYYY